MKIKIGIISFFLSILFSGLFIFKPSFAEDAALLPNAVQQFFDNNGNPLSSGKVYFYKVGTTTFKDTYTSSAATTVNQNPITLNAGGKAPTGGIYGIGLYRQVVRDRNNNLIWDAVTAPGGGGTTPTEVGDGNLVGTVLPWSGIIAPNQYVFAYGQELNRNDYPIFYTAITQRLNIICTSASNILTGVSDTTQIKIGSPVEAALCLPNGTTVVSKTTSTITVSNPSSVSINTSATFFPYGNGDGSTTFNVPDLRGYAIAGRDNMGGTAANRLTSTYFAEAGLGATGGSQSHTQTISEIAAHTHPQTGQQPTFTGIRLQVQAGSGTGVLANINIDDPSPTNTYTTIADTTPGDTASTGSATPYSIVQPTITLNYIIKVTPDTSMSTETVVTELGGMTGVISCGTGLTCNNQTVSVNSFGEATTAIKIPVKAATTGNIGLFGAQIIDGVSVVAGDRVLVKDQSIASENGIYVASNSNWTRATDFNETGEIVQGTQVYVNSGAVNSNISYQVTTVSPAIGSSLNFGFFGTGFQQNGSGTIIRNIEDKNQDIFSVKDCGATGDGVTDDTNAIQACLNNGAYSIYFPAGIYKISSKLTANGPRVLDGAGQQATRLQWTSTATSYGIEIVSGVNSAINWRTSRVSNMALETFGIGVGDALTFDYSGTINGGIAVPRAVYNTQVYAVWVRGATGYTVDGFLNGINCISCQGLTVDSSRINGLYTGPYGSLPNSEKAIKFGGSGSPVSLVVTASWISAWQDAVYTEDAEGIYLSNFEFVTVASGLRTVNAVPESGIEIVNGHIATIDKGFNLSNMKDGKISGVVIYNIADVPNVTAFVLGTGTGNIEISGNTIRRLGVVTNMLGIQASGGTKNYIGPNTFDIGSTGKAIQIDASATATRVARQVFVSVNSTPNIDNGVSSVFDEYQNYAGDLNSITTSFEWTKQIHTLAGGVTNGPSGIGSTAGSIVQTNSYASNTAQQIFYSATLNRIYIRRLVSGSWTAWVYAEFTTDGLPTNVALHALSELTPAADKVPYFTGPTSAALADLTSFGRSLIASSNASAARTVLGLGTISTQNANSVSITGGTITGITDLTIADGGTGASTAQQAAANIGASYTLAQSAIAASHTGNTLETTLATINVPANSMGANGRVRITTEWSYTNSANNKSIRIKFGGTNYTSIAVTTSASTRVYTVVSNVNATNSQKGVGSGSFGWTVTSSTPVTSSVDTTLPVSIDITGQLANPGETITLENYAVEILYGN